MSNWINKKLAKLKGDSSLEQDLFKQSIRYDAFDELFFNGLAKRDKILKEKTEKGLKIWKGFKELQMDVFYSLYKYLPRLVPQAAMEKEYMINQMVMEEILEHNKYKELRMITKMDKMNSIIGTEILSDELIKILKRLQQEQQELMDKLKQAMEEMKKAQAEAGEGNGEGEGQGVGMGEGEEGEGDEEGKSIEEITLEEAKKRLEEARKEMKKALSPMVNQGIESGYQKISDKKSKVSNFIQQWGFENNAYFQKKPYKEKLKLMEQIEGSSKLKQIAKLLGRQRMIATSKKKLRVRHAESTLADMQAGADLSRVNSTELALLKNDKTKILFYKKFIDQSLMQYKFGGFETLGYGPMVVCIDSSGSMNGTPEVWSKAVALALLEVANRQRRNFHVIHFDASRYDDLKTHTFLHSKKGHNPDHLIEMAQYFAGGGTSFEDPLIASRKKIDADENFSRADIVFITDGHCSVGDKFVRDFNKWKESRKVQLHSILINYGGYGVTDASLKEFSDEVVTLSSFDKDDADEVSSNLYDKIQPKQ